MDTQARRTGLMQALVVAGFLAGALLGPAHAAQVNSGAQVNTGYFGSVAIKGYDTVAYFTMSKAVKGSEQISYDWLGATWYFANAEHRKLFVANPMSYAPQFGGLCTEGVANGEVTVNIEPTTWQIIDGKLYLSAGAQFEDLPANTPKAEKNWPAVQAELSR